MSGAPFRSFLRNVDGDCKEGSNQSCWGALATVAGLWLLALWKPWGLRGVGGILNISSPSARSISESCMTSVARTHFPSTCWVWGMFWLLWLPLPLYQSNSLSGVCIKVPALEKALGHPSLSLPSGLPLHSYVWETEEHRVWKKIHRLFKTVLLFKDLA